MFNMIEKYLNNIILEDISKIIIQYLKSPDYIFCRKIKNKYFDKCYSDDKKLYILNDKYLETINYVPRVSNLLFLKYEIINSIHDISYKCFMICKNSIYLFYDTKIIIITNNNKKCVFYKGDILDYHLCKTINNWICYKSDNNGSGLYCLKIGPYIFRFDPCELNFTRCCETINFIFAYPIDFEKQICNNNIKSLGKYLVYNQSIYIKNNHREYIKYYSFYKKININYDASLFCTNRDCYILNINNNSLMRFDLNDQFETIINFSRCKSTFYCL